MPNVDRRVVSYVAELDSTLRPLAKSLRSAVRQNAPRLTERWYRGFPQWWGEGPVIYLAAYTRHINLGFLHGASLTDPEELLEGTGKSLRHVKIRTLRDAKSAKLAALIARAAKVAPASSSELADPE